jgi:hypothetical protein
MFLHTELASRPHILQLTSSTNTGPVMLLVNQPVRYNSIIRAKFSFIKEYRMVIVAASSGKYNDGYE